jgi:hypothetical protein
MINGQLQLRDKDIVDFLATQGFATHEQLAKAYFPSYHSTYNRLMTLEKNGIIRSKPAASFFSRRPYLFEPHLNNLGVRKNTRIYQLSLSQLRFFPRDRGILKTSMLVHQLLLNEVRIWLQRQFPEAIFMNENRLRMYGRDFINHNPDFMPDLVMKVDDVVMAVELERVKKSESRYVEKIRCYEDSLYTHVLYIFTNGENLKIFFKLGNYDKRFGFASYSRPETVSTKRFGDMPFKKWVDQISKMGVLSNAKWE